MKKTIQLERVDALELIDRLPRGSIDCVCTDPPYSSGATHAGDRRSGSSSKYVNNRNRVYADFEGDTLDQRSWSRYTVSWLTQLRRKARPGAYALIFVDWRQLPTLSDCFQIAGWTWRGTIAWNKGRSARLPHVHYFRHQAEFILWGTNGAFDRSKPISADTTLDGAIDAYLHPAKKLHPTQKPLAVVRKLVAACNPGGLVVDPFAGSGTGAIAAAELGLRFAGCEIDAAQFDLARFRLEYFRKNGADITETPTAIRDVRELRAKAQA